MGTAAELPFRKDARVGRSRLFAFLRHMGIESTERVYARLDDDEKAMRITHTPCGLTIWSPLMRWAFASLSLKRNLSALPADLFVHLLEQLFRNYVLELFLIDALLHLSLWKITANEQKAGNAKAMIEVLKQKGSPGQENRCLAAAPHRSVSAKGRRKKQDRNARIKPVAKKEIQ